MMCLRNLLLSNGCQEVVHGNRGSIYYANNEKIVAKQCTKCSLVKYLDSFRKQKDCLGGVRSSCKDCDDINNKHYRDRTVEKRREYATKYREDNRDREKERTRKWIKENKEKHDASRERWKRNNEEKVKAYKKVWYLENKEQLQVKAKDRYEKNKEHVKERVKNYIKENPHIPRVVWHRKRARDLSLPHNFTAEDYKSVMKTFNEKCALTGSSENVQVDHVIPLSTNKGGTVVGNIIPLRADLNNSKHSNNIFEWFITNKERLNLSQDRFDKTIRYLAEANEMTTEEYRNYVYSCFKDEEVTE